MYKQIQGHEVEGYIRKGHQVLFADFENEDIESVNLMSVGGWIRLGMGPQDGSIVFAVKVTEND